jgi:hypothetical protein
MIYSIALLKLKVSISKEVPVEEKKHKVGSSMKMTLINIEINRIVFR